MKYYIPESLETKRLLLRIPEERDWEELYAYYSDEDCMKYTSRRAHTEGETWRVVAMMRGHWEFRKFGPYVLELKSTGAIVGVAGMWYPNEWPEPEIKWGVLPNYQRNGFAREAAEKVRETAAENIPDLKLISLIDKGNQASIALALSMGCDKERDFELRGILCSVYRHR